MNNSLAALAAYGQSFWLDYIRRSFVEGGAFQQMIERDGLRGVTSNPAIFEKAIAGGAEYASGLQSEEDEEGQQVYERLAAHDIRAAADLLKPVYDRTEKADGYVSMEVSPVLAYDTPATIAEARRLWRMIERPNVMIKVPGTPEGLPAVGALLEEGINVNITLLFSRQVYEKTAETYLNALEARVRRGESLSSIASVASFFVSRIDTVADEMLKAKLGAGPRLEALSGKAAIANAKLTYRRFREIFSGPRWTALSSRGARPQRPLWASTSTKNPAYRDVLYVEELIGADTVNTLPQATADAFRDHGRLRNSLEEDPAGAGRVLDEIESLGISLDKITDRLLEEGVAQFASAFESLLEVIQKAKVEAPAR